MNELYILLDAAKQFLMCTDKSSTNILDGISNRYFWSSVIDGALEVGVW